MASTIRANKTSAGIIEINEKGKEMEEVLNKALDTVPKDANIRIRKLTPKECWRLMGFSKRNEDGTFDDSAFERAAQVNSNTQLYKQAGNSIVVDVLEAIFKQMM